MLHIVGRTQIQKSGLIVKGSTVNCSVLFGGRQAGELGGLCILVRLRDDKVPLCGCGARLTNK